MLQKLCSPDGDRLIEAERRAAAKLLRGLQAKFEQAEEVLEKLRAGSAAGARVARWQLFPRERGVPSGGHSDGDPQMFSGEALLQWRSESELTSAMRELSKLAGHGARQMDVGKRGKGAPRKTWLTYFVHIVADEYEMAGGNVSASWKEGNKRKPGRRDSPFLRVLTRIHSHLPAERQAKPASSLTTRARETIVIRKSWTNKS